MLWCDCIVCNEENKQNIKRTSFIFFCWPFSFRLSLLCRVLVWFLYDFLFSFCGCVIVLFFFLTFTFFFFSSSSLEWIFFFGALRTRSIISFFRNFCFFILSSDPWSFTRCFHRCRRHRHCCCYRYHCRHHHFHSGCCYWPVFSSSFWLFRKRKH